MHPAGGVQSLKLLRDVHQELQRSHSNGRERVKVQIFERMCGQRALAWTRRWGVQFTR